MEHTPDEKKIVDLLSKLKNSNGAYPSDMLESRRRRFAQQVANAGLGIGVGSQIKKSMQNGNGVGATTTITSKIVETALIAAIVIEAGTAAYLYRGKIAEFIRSYTSPNVQQVVPQPDNTSGNPVIDNGLQTPLPTGSETPSGTPATSVFGETNSNNNSNTGVNATPNPTDDKGNQYGLTPKPERTKDNGDNENNGGGNNDNQNNGGGNK